MYKHLGTHWQNSLADTANYVHRCDSQQGRKRNGTILGCIHVQINDWLEALLKQIIQELPASSVWGMAAVWKCPARGGTSSELVINKFTKCCLSNGTEDILWEEGDGCRQLFG
jgi:hypothetical protein